ncbi:MAG: rod-binding protein [Pseudomonadota bacterium]
MTDFLNSLTPSIGPLTTLQTPGAQSSSSATDFEASARKQATDFEAAFISALLQPVFEGLARDSTFGGGFAEETWTGLLTQEYAKGISGSANLGVADQVYEQLISLQERNATAASQPAEGESRPISFVSEDEQ